MIIKNPIFCLLIFLLTGCSYQVKPVIPQYSPDVSNVIHGNAKIKFAGNFDKLDGQVYNDSNISCRAMTFSITMKDEFQRSVRRLINAKFVSLNSESNFYDIEITLEDFRAAFRDLMEQSFLNFGTSAPPPELNADAQLQLLVVVKKNGKTVIDRKVNGYESKNFTYWSCGDAARKVQKVTEIAAKRILESIDRYALTPLSSPRTSN